MSNIVINTDLLEKDSFLFFAPYYNEGYIVILNSTNEIVYYKKIGNYGARDFKMHKNGLMSYFSGESEHFIILNEKLELVDSVQCKNDLTTDFHDFTILKNGNYCLLCRGTTIKDFSNVGGSTEHLAVNPIIQIQDILHHVIYEWEAAQYYDGEYVIHPLNNFSTAGNLKNYIHFNSFDIDSLSNFLVSSRFQSQVSYVDKTSGEILWRLGGPQNEFTFVGDPGFSDQHSARWSGKNTILLFDNGCFDEKNYSRVVEYELDIENKTATKIWEFIRPDSIHTGTLGNCQRLANGNTLTSWGDAGLQPLTILEISPEGSIVFDLNLDSLIYTYSAYRYDWHNDNDTTKTFLNTPAQKNHLPVFPNPSKKYFYIPFDDKFEHLKLYDSNGNIMLEQAISNFGSPIKVNHNLCKGAYILSIRDIDDKISFSKIVIQ